MWILKNVHMFYQIFIILNMIFFIKIEEKRKKWENENIKTGRENIEKK